MEGYEYLALWLILGWVGGVIVFGVMNHSDGFSVSIVDEPMLIVAWISFALCGPVTLIIAIPILLVYVAVVIPLRWLRFHNDKDYA